MTTAAMAIAKWQDPRVGRVDTNWEGRPRAAYFNRGVSTFRLPHVLPYRSTEALEYPIDPLERYIAERLKRSRDVLELHLAYRHRIDELSRYGEDEDIALNEASERDFWAFVTSTAFSRRAGLVLMDNGNLRAVWEGEGESHLGLHFLGGQSVRYVIFSRRAAGRRISRVAGTDTFEGIRSQIREFDLMSLVNE